MKKSVFLFLLVIAIGAQMSAQYETIWGRNPRYYSEWYDTCPGYYHPWQHGGPFNDSIYQSGLAFVPIHQDVPNFKVGVSYHTSRPLSVKGLVALVNIDPSGYSHAGAERNPEFLYLYQYTSSLQFRDSVRWDTASPKIVRFPKAIDTATLRYYESYAYEGMFTKGPVVVDSTFYIAGSFNSDTGNRAVNPIIPTEYTWFMWGLQECQYSRKVIDYYPPYIGVPELGEHWVWRDHPGQMPWQGIGAYLPIVDSLYLVQGMVDDTAHGFVVGSGYYNDSIFMTLYAHPKAGYRFSHWSDGDTINPRQVFVLGDTAFTAYFDSLQLFHLDVSSNNPELGLARGTGDYYDGYTATLAAVPGRYGRFVRWSDGVTDNPRHVIVTQDSSIVALFANDTVGIESLPERRGLRLSPYPASERLNIAVDRSDRYTATIYTVTGALWLREEFDGTEGRMDISPLTPGTYLLRLDAKGFTTSEVFIKGK